MAKNGSHERRRYSHFFHKKNITQYVRISLYEMSPTGTFFYTYNMCYGNKSWNAVNLDIM